MRLDSKGLQSGRVSGAFRVDRLLLNGRGRVLVDRNGLRGGDLSFRLGPPTYNLELATVFARAALEEVDLSLTGGVGSDSTLSGAVHVEDGEWTPRVRFETRVDTIEWTSTWRFNGSGLRKLELGLAIDADWLDGRVELEFGPQGFDAGELRLSSSRGPLSLTSTTGFTAGGFERTELEAVVRVRYWTARSRDGSAEA